MYNIHFVVKLLGFICICIKAKTFYHPKFQMVLNVSIFNISLLYYLYHANIHPMVVVFFN